MLHKMSMYILDMRVYLSVFNTIIGTNYTSRSPVYYLVWLEWFSISCTCFSFNPLFLQLLAVFISLSLLRPTIATLAPLLAKSIAVAAPMPELAPEHMEEVKIMVINRISPEHMEDVKIMIIRQIK